MNVNFSIDLVDNYHKVGCEFLCNVCAGEITLSDIRLYLFSFRLIFLSIFIMFLFWHVFVVSRDRRLKARIAVNGLAWRADCSNSFLRESFHFYLNGLNFVWWITVFGRQTRCISDELNVMYDVVSLNCTNAMRCLLAQVIWAQTTAERVHADWSRVKTNFLNFQFSSPKLFFLKYLSFVCNCFEYLFFFLQAQRTSWAYVLFEPHGKHI